jgi:hypothetical protein
MLDARLDDRRGKLDAQFHAIAAQAADVAA